MEKDIRILPMLVMREVVVFPNMIMHLDVSRPASVKAVNAAVEGDRYIFLTAQRDPVTEEPDIKDICRIGCVAVIRQVISTPNEENIRIVVEGIYRGKWDSVLSCEDHFQVGVSVYADKMARIGLEEKEATLRFIKNQYTMYEAMQHKGPTTALHKVRAENDLGHLCDLIASQLAMPWEKKQAVLEQAFVAKRVKMILDLLCEESEILRYTNEINEKVQRNVAENQRDYYLREQIKVLNEELYGEDDYDEIAEYRSLIDKLNASDFVKDKLRKELEKLSRMPQGAHEATVVYNYLDTCLELPWGTYSEDSIDLAKARKILDKEHYGMQKVKERILEMLAVRKLAPEQQGQILCLVGPPGVGKTSIAASIAACMGRKYVRVALGGIKDESEIRGHRRTYIGAMPGRIIDAIKISGTSNPLMLLDEIDKIGSDFKGDCSASLLEALDPEQNRTFQDHYVDMPYDLSKVLFVTTANDASTIPSALFDRMEVIELQSYTREEKFNIAKKHLVAKQRKKHGLTAKTFRISDSAIYELIDSYTREGGVRTLERRIASLCRKAACSIVEGKAESVAINPSSLKDYLGCRKFRKEDVSNQKDEVGLVNGLAWTSVGGEVMRLEAAALVGTGKIELTGSLGDVMKESAKTAIGYVRSRAADLDIDADFYKTRDIHIHATEAAVPKDGPSAGVTMATAIVSALTGRPIRHDVAMTGEISLRGRVLAIGGLKEKTMAAYKAGVKTVLIPEENAPDLEEIDAVVRDNLRFVICDSMDTVLKEALV